MSLIRLEIATHHFVASQLSDRARRAVDNFIRQLIQYGFVRERGRYIRKPSKVYASKDYSGSTFRFHINHYKEFCKFLDTQGVAVSEREVIQRPSYEPFKCELKVLEKWVPRPKQVPAIEFIDRPDIISGFVDLPPGTGKTLSSLINGSHFGVRIGIVVKPGYVERWQRGLLETYEITKDEIMVIQGGKNLRALFELQAMGGLDDIKVIIFSNKTLQDWFKLYERFGKGGTETMGYVTTPPDMFEFLQIGFRIIDEVHEYFHFNFKLDLCTHCPKSVALSGTLTNDDEFVKSMMMIAYPKAMRYEDHDYVKYIDAKAYFYSFENLSKIRTTEPGASTYSHNAFEKSIMRQPQVKSRYMGMIKYIIDNTYIKNYKPGNKLMVFASSIAFCGELTQYLAEKYPQFSVKRYVGEDPESNLMDPDMRVSTLLSAGTAVDIPGLQTSILTHNISSSVSNIQGAGRTREMKDGQTPEFVWTVCQDIPQHIKYHERRKQMLEPRLRSYDSRHYHTRI